MAPYQAQNLNDYVNAMIYWGVTQPLDSVPIPPPYTDLFGATSWPTPAYQATSNTDYVNALVRWRDNYWQGPPPMPPPGGWILPVTFWFPKNLPPILTAPPRLESTLPSTPGYVPPPESPVTGQPLSVPTLTYVEVPGSPPPPAGQPPWNTTHPPPGPTKPPPVATIAGANPMGYSPDQLQQIAAMFYTAQRNRVTGRVLLALALIGVAENDWDENTCNKSNHCGVFQLDGNWQAMHRYSDTGWWAAFALHKGFYGHGGLIQIDRDHPSWSVSEMVQACQGAGPTWQAAVDYYTTRLAEARNVVKYYWTGGNTSPPPNYAPARYANPLAYANVTAERIDMGVDYAGTGYYTAFAACQITHIFPGGWGKYGNYIEYVITEPGPLQGDYFYMAEGVTPTVKEGDRLRAGDKICDLIPTWYYGTELGQSAGTGSADTWANHFGGGWTPAQDGAHDATRAGIAFSNLIGRLGGHTGYVRGSIIGAWPRWCPNGNVPSEIVAGIGGSGSGSGSSSQGGTVRQDPVAKAASLSDAAVTKEAWNNLHDGVHHGRTWSDVALFEARQYKWLRPKQPA
jgi:hypothetical protein